MHGRSLGIKRIVARALKEDPRRVLEAVGASEVFNAEEEAARNMVQRLTISSIRNYFVLADGISLVEVEAPAGTVGRSLRELDLRQRFRVNLVAIKRMTTTPNAAAVLKQFKAVPLPDDIIEAGDVLALAGSVLDLARFVADNSWLFRPFNTLPFAPTGRHGERSSSFQPTTKLRHSRDGGAGLQQRWPTFHTRTTPRQRGLLPEAAG